MSRPMRIVELACAIACATAIGSCKRGDETSAPGAASTSPSVAPTSSVDIFPLSKEQIAAVVNPGHAPEYGGPTGVIEGTIHVTGAPPTRRTLVLPKGCEKAGDIAAPSYRAGPNGELMDALVAVIGVSAYVPPSRADREVVIKDCAIDPTAIDLSFGQRLMVSTTDADQTYIPQVPTGGIFKRLILKDMPAAPVLITKPGIYELTWFTGVGVAYPSALVYVLPNALHVVTGHDGKYRIGNVPVGKAHVTVAHRGLPEVAQDVDVKAGEALTVDLTVNVPEPAIAPSTSAAPKPSIK